MSGAIFPRRRSERDLFMDVFHSHYRRTQHKKSVKRSEKEIILGSTAAVSFFRGVQPTQHFSPTWLFIAPFRRRRCMLLILSKALVNTEHLHCLPKIPTYIFHPQMRIHFVAKHTKSVLRGSKCTKAISIVRDCGHKFKLLAPLQFFYVNQKNLINYPGPFLNFSL